MIAVRGFLLAFSAVVGVLMALISLVFVGSTLMSGFYNLGDLGQALVASAILSAILAVPLAAAGDYRGYRQVANIS